MIFPRPDVFALTLVFLLGGAASAQAQAILPLGQTVRGQLTASDPTLPDKSHYDCFVTQTTVGKPILVEHRSPDFDAYLLAGIGRSCDDISTISDDDGAGGTDARLVIPGDGEPWFLVVGSLMGGETGSYVLTTSYASQDDADRPLTPQEQADVDAALAALSGAARQTIGERRAGIAIASGQSLSGRLSLLSGISDDDRFYDCYNFTARSGVPATITVDSGQFDAFVILHSGEGCTGTKLAEDDDSGGRLNARLFWRPSADGRYSYRVTTASEAEAGNYQTRLTQ